MYNVFANLQSLNGEIMKQIESIVNQIRTIMKSNGISQNFIINATDGKCSRATIINFLSGQMDCKMSTLLIILEVIGAQLRIETEMSKEALLAGDISAYREKTERLRMELAAVTESRDFFKSRYEELIDKNTALTATVEKQQNQIERYMARMERAEDAIYRKDSRIVELSKLCGKW